MVVLLAASMAFAHPYVAVPVAPVPVVVQSYYAPPVYAYPRPVVVAAPYLVASPVVAAPVVVPVPAPVYVRPVVVHPKFYVPGQPVRNVFRAVTP
jgi:hypothetical protein